MDLDLEVRYTLTSSDASATLYPAIVSSVYNDLKFSVGGYRGMETLPFVALLEVFDGHVWFLIFFKGILILVFQQVPSLLQQ